MLEKGLNQPFFFGILKQSAVAVQAEPLHGALFLGADGLDAAIQVLRNLRDGHTAGQ